MASRTHEAEIGGDADLTCVLKEVSHSVCFSLRETDPGCAIRATFRVWRLERMIPEAGYRVAPSVWRYACMRLRGAGASVQVWHHVNAARLLLC